MRHLRNWAFALACAIFVMLAATASAAVVESPHATVAGKTLQQWSAEWWQKTFSLPVYAADGKTITHPQFDAPINPGDVVDAKHGLLSDDGNVFFLFGSFFGGDIDRTVTVPAGKPIFVP